MNTEKIGERLFAQSAGFSVSAKVLPEGSLKLAFHRRKARLLLLSVYRLMSGACPPDRHANQ